jgi:hypothetical protein
MRQLIFDSIQPICKGTGMPRRQSLAILFICMSSGAIAAVFRDSLHLSYAQNLELMFALMLFGISIMLGASKN